jgi:hypothetical protein
VNGASPAVSAFGFGRSRYLSPFTVPLYTPIHSPTHCTYNCVYADNACNTYISATVPSGYPATT